MVTGVAKGREHTGEEADVGGDLPARDDGAHARHQERGRRLGVLADDVEELLVALRGAVEEEAREHHAGAQRVHAHREAVHAALRGERVGEVRDAGLGGAVGGVVGGGQAVGARAVHVEDVAEARLPRRLRHGADGGARAEECAAQVGASHGLKVCLRGF